MTPDPSTGRRPARKLRWLAALALIAVGGARPPAAEVDTLIRGGTIYDGGTGRAFVGDVAIAGDRIVYVGAARRVAAKTVIDARGMIVAPGFIDPHTHPDSYIRSADPRARLNLPWLAQGVSTIGIGVDGYGTPDVGGDVAGLVRSGIGTNVFALVGFGAVRGRVIGAVDRAPTADELARMQALVAKGMCEGATGLSTGLFYAPQVYAKTEEVIALAKEAALRGGLYDTHQRDESDYTLGVLGSAREVLRIGREAGLPVHFAHIKTSGTGTIGKARELIALIAAARANGQDVSADHYPWLASGTSLEASLVPRWASDGGTDAMITRLDDPAAFARIRGEMVANLRRRGGANVQLLSAEGWPWSGRTLAAMAAEWRIEPVDAAIRILRAVAADGRRGGASTVSFNMGQGDVDLFMRQPWVVTGSDGSDGHPRQYATFPEKYATYVRKRRVIDLAAFIRRSTGLTADIYRIARRGYLRPGYFADVVVFDPARFAPRADYLRPREPSVGVRALFVNGALALRDGAATGAAAGRGLLRTPPAGTCPP